MKKIVEFLIVIILLQSVFSVDPWRNVQKFFNNYDNSQPSAKQNASLLTSTNEANEGFDNIISSLEKSKRQKANEYFEKVPEIIKSKASSSDTVNIYNNIVNIINNSQNY